MDESVSKKISDLKILKNVLIAGMVIVGVITVVDLFVPDPIFLLDEVALAAITALLKVLSGIVDNKIELLSNGEKVDINSKDALEVADAFKDTVSAVKKSRKK